jgi:2',3'-cyclic-nucleotide 2'-phosphodiesterase (5'-nucleotidase family)
VSALRHSKFDWLGDNLEFDTGSPDADSVLQKSFTFEAGGRRVGVFALTLHPDDGGNVRDYVPMEGDYFGRANEVLAAFEFANLDAIVGLTHLHLVDDIEIATLKAQYPQFVFIVGGHEHEPEHKEGTDSSAEIMKGASNARTVWQIDLFFDEAGNADIETAKIEIDDSIALDPDYELIAKKWRDRLLDKMPFLPSKVGVAAVPLDAREVTVRNEESNWANFIADQMLTAYRGDPAELAFVNSGTLRIDDFIADDISFEDIGRTFGYSSYLRYMTMNGRDFRALLEAGYRGLGPSKGYFPQIAGFRVCVDRNRPVGQRIVQMMVPSDGGWQEIDIERDYSVVAPDFIFRGGDGYDFSKARDVSKAGSELQYLVLDAILVAQAEGRAVGDAVDPKNRRTAFLQQGQSACFD